MGPGKSKSVAAGRRAPMAEESREGGACRVFTDATKSGGVACSCWEAARAPGPPQSPRGAGGCGTLHDRGARGRKRLFVAEQGGA